MKALVDVAVFGLMPVPVTYSCSGGDTRWPKTREANASQLASCPDGTTERMATTDELARICHELKHINADLTARSLPAS